MAITNVGKLLLAALLACGALLRAQTGPDEEQTEQPQASERIRSFDAWINVEADGVIKVREAITVEAAGVEIKHGIYRDFPTRYRGLFGVARKVDFKVTSIGRDGHPEPWRLEDLDNGVRIYIGHRNVLIAPGPHTYTIHYQTNRQLGYFRDHDEFYWNVNGLGWNFPVDEITASVVLPPEVRRTRLELEGYTGAAGERGTAYTARRDAGGNAFFQARSLGAGEGLTIVVSWPKGLVTEPDFAQSFRWFMQDNRAVIVGLAGLAIVLVYYVLVWAAVGRDPHAGTIMPLYEPPANISPAAMRYLERMEFDDRMFTSAIVDLAAKGYAGIERDASEVYSATRKPEETRTGERLAADEKAMAKKLFEEGSTVRFEQKNHELISRARDALRLALRTSMEKVYFVTNIRYLWPGIALTALTVVALMVVNAIQEGPLVLFMCVWLSGWTMGVVMLLRHAFLLWYGVFTEGFFKEGNFMAVFLTLFSMPFVAAEIFVLVMLYQYAGLPVFLIMAAAIGSNTVFYHLLRAPTRAGRQVLDRIEGFRMFLGAVEGDRMAAMPPPEKTPKLFERFLPYAMALGVEQKWAAQFTEVLARAREAAGGYSPSWYSGAGLGTISATAFASSFGSSFSSAVSSSASAPGSSSGSGGGGSSGGGGGGGGGGGW